MTTEELLEQMENSPELYAEQEVFVIDNALRVISIPAGKQTVGVESDEDVNRLQFQMPKQYGEVDLADFDIRINYMNANGNGDVYAVTDKAVSGDNITFSWLVGRNALAYKGTVKFIVCLKKADAEGVVQQEFNTTLAQLNVLEGLETTEQIVQENPDVIETILQRLDDLEENGGSAGTPGQDGREIELQKSATAIQWRYEGDETWTDLVQLSEITGPDGPPGAPGPAGQDGSPGPAGADGKTAYQYAQEGGYTGSEAEFKAKLATEYAEPIYKQTMTSIDATPALSPNKRYEFPDMASLAYTLIPPEDNAEAAIYWFVFGSPADAATTVTHPEGVTVDGPTIAAGKRYEVSIAEGLAIIKEWEAAT